MENIVYLLVVFLLGAIWIYTYTQMVIVLERNSGRYDEIYTIYIDTEDGSFFLHSIEYDEVRGTYHFKYCYTPEDDVIELTKYEAILITLWMNSLEDDDEPFKLKKM